LKPPPYRKEISHIFFFQKWGYSITPHFWDKGQIHFVPCKKRKNVVPQPLGQNSLTSGTKKHCGNRGNRGRNSFMTSKTLYFIRVADIFGLVMSETVETVENTTECSV